MFTLLDRPFFTPPKQTFVVQLVRWRSGFAAVCCVVPKSRTEKGREIFNVGTGTDRGFGKGGFVRGGVGASAGLSPYELFWVRFRIIRLSDVDGRCLAILRGSNL